MPIFYTDTGSLNRLEVSGSTVMSGEVVISGSLTVPGGITGSLLGTASFAINGGVTQITAGTNITISPVEGTGNVTINATGGGGGTTPAIQAATSLYLFYNY